MALRSGGRFACGELTTHTLTNITMVERFLDCRITAQRDGHAHVVEVSPTIAH
jgi:RNA 3'-terminal phosphate cyclase